MQKNSADLQKSNSQLQEVWILDDDPMTVSIIEKQLTVYGYKVRGFIDAPGFIAAYLSERPDWLLVIIDYQLNNTTGLDVINQLRQKGRAPDFLAMTGFGDERIAVGMMQAGAIDYIIKEKGFVAHMPVVVESAFKRMVIDRRLKKTTSSLKSSLEKQKKLNQRIRAQNTELASEKAKVEKLLQNILPVRVARELLTTGTAKARFFSCVSVLYADVEDFSVKSAMFGPIELLEKLDEYFSMFDSIIGRLGLEKIKTIGDCYMCAGGIPESDALSPPRVVLAGLQIQHAVDLLARDAIEENQPYFTLRVGIHTGQVVAGVIGRRKFSYDIWGNAANKAHWMVQEGEVGKVNISGQTFEIVSKFFDCTYRGKLETKHQLLEDMYFVNKLKPQWADDEPGLEPNIKFLKATGLL